MYGDDLKLERIRYIVANIAQGQVEFDEITEIFDLDGNMSDYLEAIQTKRPRYLIKLIIERIAPDLTSIYELPKDYLDNVIAI